MITRVRAYNPATASGTLIVTEMPARFPPFLGAVLYLKQAMRIGKARIRLEYQSPWARVVEFDIVTLYHEALRQGYLRKTLLAAEYDPIVERFQCWSGFGASTNPLPASHDVSGKDLSHG